MPAVSKERVHAVVVTRNRRDLLAGCLDALAAQSRPPDGILVVDNASTDGTAEWLRARFPGVEVLSLAENGGSSGGFSAGIAASLDGGSRWLWLLDDDSAPDPTALERLLEARDGAPPGHDPVVLASKVVWTDGRPHPMNIPNIDLRRWPVLLAAPENGTLPLRWASFVSLLLRADAVARHGLPLTQYFVWFDDVEYTARILREERGLYVPSSRVEHRTAEAYETVEGTGERFFFAVRNRVYLLRSPSLTRVEKLRMARSLLRDSRRYVAAGPSRRAALATIARAAARGVFTLPSRLRPDATPATRP
jgi:GT2 family glycosyltransferase